MGSLTGSRKAMGTLIIGIGNTLRGDDGVGQHAATLLAEALASDDVEVIACHQLTLELSESLSRAAAAVFIDAEIGGSAGDIRVRPLVPAGAELFTHGLTPETLLSAALALYGRAPKAWLYTICGEDFGYKEQLSSAVGAAVEDVAQRVTRFCQSAVSDEHTSRA
jgi:hydrogenase maturation protease